LLRRLTTLEDAERVRAIIERVWGGGVLPTEFMRALQHAGCSMLGAERAGDSEGGGDVVGFVLGFVGWDEGLHLHSHMLAVVPGWQSKGVGRALKVAQR